MKNKKAIYLVVGIVIVFGLIVFSLSQNNAKKQNGPLSMSNTPTNKPVSISSTPTAAAKEQKISLIGTVKQLNNNSDPAQYSYELTLNSPFNDKLESTGDSYMTKMPILSRDKVLQESIKGYIGKEIIVNGLMAWGLAESRYLEVSTITDISSWTLYTNKTYGYSLKLPTTYQVPAQSARQISQLGVDNNIAVEKKSDPNGSSVIVIDVYPNKENMSLADYMNSNLKTLNITGPLTSYNFNSYDSLINKNQPGTNVFLKNSSNIYHITASTASQDTEIGGIIATFKFTQ
jgi:hypothetical protein